MSVILKTINAKEKELKYGQMDLIIPEIGSMIKQKERESSIKLMEVSMKETLNVIGFMALENIHLITKT